MRTKTLLLIAVASAAGLASSMAQAVYSVNAVGYVNTKVPAKSFAMISNPLKAATNTINALFGGQVPDFFAVYIYNPKSATNNGSYAPTQQWDPLGQNFPDGDVLSILPGGGAFVQNPSANDVTITFVGEVQQGNLTVPLVPGFQIVSSPVPQEGPPSLLQIPTDDQGASIYQWNTPAAPNKYEVSQVDPFATPPKWTSTTSNAEPTIHVGEAFWMSRTTPGSWNRTFSVNP